MSFYQDLEMETQRNGAWLIAPKAGYDFLLGTQMATKWQPKGNPGEDR